MTRSLQAICENGEPRPLEPRPLKKHQRWTLIQQLQAALAE